MALLPRPALNPVMEACRATGRWQIMARRGDWWYVANTDDRRQHEIGVRYSEKLVVAKFSCLFPIRFPLQREPAGLFARLLMRSHDLNYARWVMHISDSCEGQPYLFAQWPVSALTTAVFDGICREMHIEIEAFAYELRGKFQYGGVYVPAQEKAGVPAVRPDDRGIQWVVESK
jgi:hypothetical protein